MTRTRTGTPLRLLVVALVACGALVQTGCPSPEDRAEALDATKLPEEVRADYEVFAQRCSKCHSLSRPLNSGIVDDDYWAMYVARMRRQPASGISTDDARVILRFLHYYSLEQIRKKETHAAAASAALAPVPPPPAPTPADAGTSDAK
jgi:cytochrome c5